MRIYKYKYESFSLSLYRPNRLFFHSFFSHLSAYISLSLFYFLSPIIPWKSVTTHFFQPLSCGWGEREREKNERVCSCVFWEEERVRENETVVRTDRQRRDIEVLFVRMRWAYTEGEHLLYKGVKTHRWPPDHLYWIIPVVLKMHTAGSSADLWGQVITTLFWYISVYVTQRNDISLTRFQKLQ